MNEPVIFRRAWPWLLAIAGVVYCAVESFNTGDLYIYLRAAGILRQGGNMYTTMYVSGQYHYYYSVLFAYCLQPFYSLPFELVNGCWKLFNCALSVHLFWLMMRSPWMQSLTTPQRKWFGVLLALFAFRFFHDNIHTGQITILIFWCSVFGLKLIFDGRLVGGAALLALGINIKLLPLLLIPYLLYRGKLKAVFYCIIFLFVFYALPSLLVGYRYNLMLLDSWWTLVNPTRQVHVLDVHERSFHGLSTLLSTLLIRDVPDQYAMDLPRNIGDVSLETLAKILLVTRIALAGFALFFLRSFPFKPAHTNWQRVVECSYILLLVPLLFPHQQHYAFLFIVPAFACALYAVFVTRQNKARLNWPVVFCLALTYLCADLRTILGEFNHYYEHYKILTYGALLLIPLLAWALLHGPADRSALPLRKN